MEFNLARLITLIQFLENVLSNGKLSVRLVSYDNPSGKGDNNHCCETVLPFICGTNCDHYFVICADRVTGTDQIGSCGYGKYVTGVTWDRNYITFGADIGGTINPYIIAFNTWEAGIYLKVEVWDHDDNAHDFVDGLKKKIYLSPTRHDLIHTLRETLQSNRKHKTTLVVELRVFCDYEWFGSQCDVYCRTPISSDKYICSSYSGDKVCYSGWEGSNCNVNTNECNSSPCYNGATCVDQTAQYSCQCAAGYVGRNCEIKLPPCQSHPCQNGGICQDQMPDFRCDCPPRFTGELCQYFTSATTTVHTTGIDSARNHTYNSSDNSELCNWFGNIRIYSALKDQLILSDIREYFMPKQTSRNETHWTTIPYCSCSADVTNETFQSECFLYLKYSSNLNNFSDWSNVSMYFVQLDKTCLFRYEYCVKLKSDQDYWEQDLVTDSLRNRTAETNYSNLLFRDTMFKMYTEMSHCSIPKKIKVSFNNENWKKENNKTRDNADNADNSSSYNSIDGSNNCCIFNSNLQLCNESADNCNCTQEDMTNVNDIFMQSDDNMQLGEYETGSCLSGQTMNRKQTDLLAVGYSQRLVESANGINLHQSIPFILDALDDCAMKWCFENLCVNEGSCTFDDVSNSYFCKCPPGFGGYHCELNLSTASSTTIQSDTGTPGNRFALIFFGTLAVSQVSSLKTTIVDFIAGRLQLPFDDIDINKKVYQCQPNRTDVTVYLFQVILHNESSSVQNRIEEVLQHLIRPEFADRLPFPLYKYGGLISDEIDVCKPRVGADQSEMGQPIQGWIQSNWFILVICGVLLVVALTATIYFVWRRRKSAHLQKTQNRMTSDSAMTSHTTSTAFVFENQLYSDEHENELLATNDRQSQDQPSLTRAVKN